MDNVQKFMAAFRGFDGAHGQTIITGGRVNGKSEAKTRIIREPITAEKIQEHFEGGKGIGSIPINANNHCSFGCIDIDTYPLDHADLVSKCRQLDIPGVVCRSKSGGAHIYFFINGEIPAADMRDKLSEIAAVLGQGNAEIFPKQEKLLVERGDVGNAINLPYHDVERTLRPAFTNKGKEATLQQFLAMVDKSRKTPSEFMSIQVSGGSEILVEAPPCLECHVRNGVGQGGRNCVAFNLATYFKKQNPKQWKQDIESANHSYFKPPLPASELVTIQDQIEKKDYFYQCTEPQLAMHCNKNLCRQRKYGIGNSARSVEITGLTVVKSEPRIWFVDVAGARLELTTEQLQMPTQFQRACMEQLNFMPPKLKEDTWQTVVNVALTEVVEIEVPVELTNKGQFMELLENFCTGRVQAQSWEELDLNKPYTEDGRTYFKMAALMNFLKAQNFLTYTKGQVQERIKELNEGQTSHQVKNYNNSKAEKKTVRVWSVPEFKEPIDIPGINVGGEEIPF
jgi:hypothetical protein